MQRLTSAPVCVTKLVTLQGKAQSECKPLTLDYFLTTNFRSAVCHANQTLRIIRVINGILKEMLEFLSIF